MNGTVGPGLRLSIIVVLFVAACSGGASPAPTGTPVPASVRLALDWTPNTNHSGFFVAAHEGWYAEAAIALDILPYTGTTPEALLAAHQAECGISFQDSLTFAVAAGADISSTMAILQHTASAIAVLESSDIRRPRDLDGRVYAGFGYPNEEPTLRSVIRADGGTGEFDVVTLDTAAYEALFSGRADFTIPFMAWEGVDAAQRGIGLRTFEFADYGFPDFYQVVLACDRSWLEREPEAARRFLAATVRGFEVAASDPSRAAAILREEAPEAFAGIAELVVASARFLAEGGYLVDADGRVGRQTFEQWRGYSGFLYEEGLLVDGAGAPLTDPLDYGRLFTNDYLP